MLERGLPKFASFLKEVPGTLQCFENVSRNNDRKIFFDRYLYWTSEMLHSVLNLLEKDSIKYIFLRKF